MKATLNIIAPSREFQTKSGSVAFVADATFEDEGARFPQGRARVYSDKPLAAGKTVTGYLVSYDREGARFSVRENR